MNQPTEQACQYCNGVARFRDYSYPANPPMEISPEYHNWIKSGNHEAKTAYPGPRWVCAACLGSGLHSDAVARTLAGDFWPSLAYLAS